MFHLESDMPYDNNKKKSLSKRKVPSKYRISATKEIKLNQLKATAESSVEFNSIKTHERNIDFDASVDPLLIQINQESNYEDSNLSSDCNSSFTISSINNSIIQNDDTTIHYDSELSTENSDNQNDTNETLNFKNDEEKDNYLLNALREFCLQGISKQKVDALLALLRPLFPFLPKSYKALLHTPRIISVCDLGDGQLWYKGIEKNIQQLLSDEYIQQHGEIVIDINIDGIPLSKSSEKHFWPILGKFKYSKYPFLIAVYLGPGKPNNVNEYLKEFVLEVAYLKEKGIQWTNGIKCKFKIDNFVLDAEARSFIKQCVSHNASLPSLMKNVRIQSDPHVTAVLKTLVDKQEEVNGKIDNVFLMLNRIYRKFAPEEGKVIKPKNLPTLPLSDEDAFSEMQIFLTSDDNFYPVVDYIVKLMKIDDQTDESTAVGRVLPKLISNSLARMISYSGSGCKLKFGSTKLHDAISCAVLNAFPKSNLIKMDKKISRWLYTSNQRKLSV